MSHPQHDAFFSWNERKEGKILGKLQNGCFPEILGFQVRKYASLVYMIQMRSAFHHFITAHGKLQKLVNNQGNHGSVGRRYQDPKPFTFWRARHTSSSPSPQKAVRRRLYPGIRKSKSLGATGELHSVWRLHQYDKLLPFRDPGIQR